MKLKKPDVETIKRGTAEVGKMMGFVLFATICKQIAGPVSIDIQPAYRRDSSYYRDDISVYRCNYGEAIKAVSNSFMCSSDKRDAISAIVQHQSSDYYRAIVEIADSFMCSSDKKNSIMAASRKASEECLE